MGVQGAEPHGGGHGGCPPRTKRGGVAHLSNPATSGAQATGKPKANEGGQRGVQGAKPPWQGVWGMCLQKPKGGELPALATPPRVEPKPLANPKPTGAGKMGVQGGKAPWQGAVGDVPPEQKRGRVAHLSNPATSGTQYAGKPEVNGGGKMGGSRGPQAPWQGAVGVPPHKDKRGNELPTLATPPRVGPKTLANPQPTGVGKRGSRGAKPLWRGGWGMCPQSFKRGGKLPTLAPPPRVGPKTLANHQQTGVGKKCSGTHPTHHAHRYCFEDNFGL